MNNFKALSLLVIIEFFSFAAEAQPAGYYNGTEGKSGDELKHALHDIIKNHVDFSYNQARYIINYSDADPANPNNVILFYSQISRDASLYGNNPGTINREHVWAKSHGNFQGIRPMDGDALNLRPADAIVNQNRGNLDFDYVQPYGVRDPVATSCWYNESAYEPGPLTKGQVARILFYMATRYEGGNGELDLELVSRLNNYPQPLFGNLATLLEWNNQYPPSDIERQRNERIFRIQQNRNPFVDHPEFANYIWANDAPTGPEFKNFCMIPEFPTPEQEPIISVSIQDGGDPSDVSIFWGNVFDSETHQQKMNLSGDIYLASISFSGYNPGEIIYLKVVVTNTSNEKTTCRSNYLLPEKIDTAQLTSINQVQGTGISSPLADHEVIISGRVTANFDNSFYLQAGTEKRSGINIYNTLFTGKEGDSLVVRGIPSEYSNLTELTNISYVYNFKSNKKAEPVVLTASQVNEDYEGMLVQINNVIFNKPGTVIPEENTNYLATDPSGNVVVYINRYSRLVLKSFPAVASTLVGIVSEYNGTYQILPRYINDIKVYTPVVDLTKKVKTELAVFPNPASTSLNIKTDLPIYSVKIVAINGQTIKLLKAVHGQINIQDLLPGIYILEATLENMTIRRSRFVKN